MYCPMETYWWPKVMRRPSQWRYTRINVPGSRLVVLPAGKINHHWTKNLIASLDGRRLYVTVGSNSNAAERGLAVEQGRAAIWDVNRNW